MRPSQPDIKWCIEHAEFVNDLWEKRGRQRGDWTWNEGCDELGLLSSVSYADEYDVWLLTTDDVLGMLEERGVTPELLSLRLTSIGGDVIVWLATNAVLMVPNAKECHRTPLIALMELFKSIEEATDEAVQD